MFVRSLLAASVLILCAGAASADESVPPGGATENSTTAPRQIGWRSIPLPTPDAPTSGTPASNTPAPGVPSPGLPAEGVRPAGLTADPPGQNTTLVPMVPVNGSQPASATVPGEPMTLSGRQGQVWREYDLSRYTLRVTTTARPEQAVVDWILRETGYEAWHGEPLGVLSASPRKLTVYHTPEMQAVVAGIVDRFVNNSADSRAYNLRVMTINSPTWRAKAKPFLRPVASQTPGVQAWVLPREAAAVLLADARQRSDFREHSSPLLLVHNGQSTVVSSTRVQSHVRDVTPQPNTWPAVQQEMGQIDEGFSLEFSPLSSSDGKSIDATIKCNVDRVEKLVPVILEAPTVTAPQQRARIEVPQISQFRLHERFRWPSDQVLLVVLNQVSLPTHVLGASTVAGLPISLPGSSSRADLLVLIEAKTALDPSAPNSPNAQAGLPVDERRGRY